MTRDAAQKNPLGPTGHQVAENVKRLRGAMTYRELSDRLDQLGRPIPVLGLSRIENAARRVDADDLVALAVALDVSPAALLMPREVTEVVPLTRKRGASWQAAWRWANGEQPLLAEGGEELDLRDPRIARAIRENRPYEGNSPVNEAARYLVARIGAVGPFRAEIRYGGGDTVTVRARLTFGDVDEVDSDGRS
jgi:transcriptional regulator with XRE-family HTH domain